MLTDYLLAHDDLQNILLDNIDFSWFTNYSYVKNGNDKYCAQCAIIISFDIAEAEPLPIVTSAQQIKLYVLQWAYTLTQGKTAHIYADSIYAVRVAHNFGML